MHIEPSLDTEVICLSSGDHLRFTKAAECPLDFPMNSKPLTSKNQISPISLPMAKYLPLFDIFKL
jgi:hypothetical protein